MINIETVAFALACARERCLPGREAATTYRCATVRAPQLLLPSLPMRRPKKVGGNIVALRHEHHEQQFCQVVFARDALVGLRKHAAARGTSAERLARDLVEQS